MYGADMGTLTVKLNGIKLFNARGDQGNLWLGAAFDVNLSGMYTVRDYHGYCQEVPCLLQL